MSGIALHKLTEAGERIKYLIDQGEEPESWQQSLDEIQAAINDKIIGCGMVYRNLLPEAEAYKTEAKRLLEKASAIERKAERLREYVETNMEQVNIEEVNAGTFKAKFKKLPDVAEVDNFDALPTEFKRHIPEMWEPDKKPLLDALKQGEIVTGAHLVTGRKKLVFV